MLIKYFHFPIFYLFFFLSHLVSLSFSPSFQSLSANCFRTVLVDYPSVPLFHTHGVVFLIALCVPLLSPPFVPLLHWRGQMLAGMIAEPAFLSEYTIFALDHSKRPKTAQVASVVSLSSLPVSPSSSLSSSACPVPSSRLCVSGDSLEDCGPSRDSLFPALCLLFPVDVATRRHLICRLTLLVIGVLVYIVWDRGLCAFCCLLVYCLTLQVLLHIQKKFQYCPLVFRYCLLFRPSKARYVAW